MPQVPYKVRNHPLLKDEKFTEEDMGRGEGRGRERKGETGEAGRGEGERVERGGRRERERQKEGGRQIFNFFQYIAFENQLTLWGTLRDKIHRKNQQEESIQLFKGTPLKQTALCCWGPGKGLCSRQMPNSSETLVTAS